MGRRQKSLFGLPARMGNALSLLALCILLARRAPANISSGPRQGREVLPGILVLTGYDLQPLQTRFKLPELADPYVTQLPDSVIISGTAPYFMRFRNLEDLWRGGPYELVWPEFSYANGTRMLETSWDLKPSLWFNAGKSGRGGAVPHLWSPRSGHAPATLVWYGGHMRPEPGGKIAFWPRDNFSRDVFAFEKTGPGHWRSRGDSIFPRVRSQATGNYLGHRYGHQITLVPTEVRGRRAARPAVFYEEVTSVRADGSPAVTEILEDEMKSPFQAAGKPERLISPVNPADGKPYPSTIREDGAALVEGPLYFRFFLDGEEWEAIGFSAGSFYGRYPACFASRRVADGLRGKPYQLDLTDDGRDLHDAGAALGMALGLAGGPGRPAVVTSPDGRAVRGPDGSLRVLVHAYRRDVLPDNDFSGFPTRYRLDQMFRIVILATLKVEKGPRGVLRFRIAVPKGRKPDWGSSPAAPLVRSLPSLPM